MASIVEKQLQSLLDGFEALQLEYQRIYSRCATLEVNLDSAKSQYARLAALCPSDADPLNLSVPLAVNTATDFETLINSSKIVDAKHRNKITAATRTTTLLRSTGVTIHAGQSADKPSAPTSSAMPSISESPLEQDFTVPGTPSKLGCPFASMQNRRLSAHAASVVSRYRSGSAHPSRTSAPVVNGRAASSTRGSVVDPIKAEVCAMESPVKKREADASVQGSAAAAAAGVCPIRFLDQHSPEEVAAYFESHKHELPRSHELCVKRYQTNEEQIRQLDAKYGNIVSMIQGLGQKHVPMLPDKLTEDEADQDVDDDGASHEKIRQWASTIGTGPEVTAEEEEPADNDDERQSRFDRPLRDVRLGESPSRPWGIQVPITAEDRRASTVSNVAAVATPTEHEQNVEKKPEKPRGKCPFGFDGPKPPAQADGPRLKEEKVEAKLGVDEAEVPAAVDGTKAGPKTKAVPEMKAGPETRTEPEKGEEKVEARPVFINAGVLEEQRQQQQPQMVFTGPVFIGYSVQEAMSVLQMQSNNK